MEFPAERPSTVSSILLKLKEHSPHSGELLGLSALVISGAVLLLLSGTTLTAAAIALIIFVPLSIITSPVWLPVGALVFILGGAGLSVLGFAAATAKTVSWINRFFQSGNPVGQTPFDDPRTLAFDTAEYVTDAA